MHLLAPPLPAPPPKRWQRSHCAAGWEQGSACCGLELFYPHPPTCSPPPGRRMTGMQKPRGRPRSTPAHTRSPRAHRTCALCCPRAPPCTAEVCVCVCVCVSAALVLPPAQRRWRQPGSRGGGWVACLAGRRCGERAGGKASAQSCRACCERGVPRGSVV